MAEYGRPGIPGKVAKEAANLTAVGSPTPVARGGTGTSTPQTQGSVFFAGALGVFSASSLDFFWDDVNKRLGLGTNTPGNHLHIYADEHIINSMIQAQLNVTNNYNDGSGHACVVIGKKNNAAAASFAFLIDGNPDWDCGTLNGNFYFREWGIGYTCVVLERNALADSLRVMASGDVKTVGKFRAVGGIGVGNSAAASTPGSVIKKMEVFDAAGASLGFVPIYNTIT